LILFGVDRFNVYARTWMSAFIHGVLLLATVLLIPGLLKLTPLASLATILIVVGFKLTTVSLYRTMYALAWDQFVPFIVTIVAVVFSDLLTGGADRNCLRGILRHPH
jgi:MFS superfamily sulfate permease-like transporter